MSGANPQRGKQRDGKTQSEEETQGETDRKENRKKEVCGIRKRWGLMGA